ncbi:hypothetical protein E2C01_023281 [Portunus trituberculatus]|uniref:Uncharacterized protein n=1 Tax=Portunus trituberculatus TaxID=210409 RepID=A0A5B7E9K2_PORTR|nr:hypothetical protein [Portunus trituberculatus]
MDNVLIPLTLLLCCPRVYMRCKLAVVLYVLSLSSTSAFMCDIATITLKQPKPNVITLHVYKEHHSNIKDRERHRGASLSNQDAA